MEAPATPNPAALINAPTVEQIISGTRCSPLTLKEFEGFLINEEHSVENLQFTIWYRAYCKKFDALAPEYKQLSQAPTPFNQFATPAGSIRTTASSLYGREDSWLSKLIRRRSTVTKLDKAPSTNSSEAGNTSGTGLGVEMTEQRRQQSDLPYELPGLSPSTPILGQSASKEKSKEREQPARTAAQNIAATGVVPDSPQMGVNRTQTTGAFSTFSDGDSINTEAIERRAGRFPNLRFAGLAPLISRSSREKELPEGTPLPFVDEISLIMTTFILPGSSKELNIDARMRRHILKSLRPVDENGEKQPIQSTHPDVFKDAAEHCFLMMERSLPHYMQWAKGNTNTPKRLFWTGVGALDFGIGVMIAMIALFYAHKRWWRLTSWLFIQFGVMQFYSAQKYFCSQVHGRTARQLYPWELSDHIEEDEVSAPQQNAFTTVAVPPKKAAGLSDKHAADLAAAMPFLFEPEPESAGENADPFANPDARPTIAKRKEAARIRGKWFASMRKKDGKRMPMFGPERVVEDPYIKWKHNQQIKEILIVGAVVVVILEAVFLAIPEQTPR